jgi:23S rRNA (cytidine1920-2'-O)/16S rRNA (cytidine1409-2'-O)-methyltransferase
VRGLTYSPLKGPSGNIEYLLWLQQQKAAVSALGSEKVDPETVVKEAFASL